MTMRHFRWIWRAPVPALLAVVALLAACGDAAPAPTATPSGDTEVQVTLTTDPAPARAGTVTLTFGVTDASGAPITDADARVHVTGDMPSMGHGGLEGDATYTGEGHWQVRGRLSMGGEWRITVRIERDGAFLAQREFRVQAGG